LRSHTQQVSCIHTLALTHPPTQSLRSHTQQASCIHTPAHTLLALTHSTCRTFFYQELQFDRPNETTVGNSLFKERLQLMLKKLGIWERKKNGVCGDCTECRFAHSFRHTHGRLLTHTHTSTHIHAHTHTSTHIHSHIDAQSQTPTHIETNWHALTLTHMHKHFDTQREQRPPDEEKPSARCSPARQIEGSAASM